MARAALRNRFAELGDTKGEINTPLCTLFGSSDTRLIYLRSLVISNIWGPRRANSSVSSSDGSYSVAANSALNNSSNANEKEGKDSKLSLNSLDNITRPLTCPGCRMDFKSFSGFVLHVENRSCASSMCHKFEDQINACVTQISILSLQVAEHESA